MIYLAKYMCFSTDIQKIYAELGNYIGTNYPQVTMKEKPTEEKIKERMNPMIKKLTLFLTMICVLSSAGTAFAADYLGNPRSMKFHYTTCRTIKHPENFIPIDSRDEALAEGYVPCGVCKP